VEFLAQLWGEDTESIALVQEWFGYCLTQRTEQQKALLFVGPRRGGKGTVGRVLTALLGRENVVSPRLASFGKEFGLESLIGKQLALVSDARLGPKADLDAVAENILRVTGEDQISIPRKFLPDFTATLPTRIMVFTNEPPRFTDGSGALPSRFIVLQSEVSFLGREDHTLTQRLLKELPGIFNWSLRGLYRLNERGYFRQPAAANELVEQIELLAAPVKAFLAEKCETSDPAAEVPAMELFTAWRVWCGLNGREHPGTQQSFGRDLRSALPHIKIVQHRGGGERVRCYAGIRLKK
jgi:putative DNA primase/helicase